MIRFSAGLVVVAIGVLIGGVATSKLSLVYVAIAVSAVALIVLAIGVALKRDELFGGGPESAPAGVGADSGTPVGQSVGTGDVRGRAGHVREDQNPIPPKKVPGPATAAFEAAAAAQAAAPVAAPTVVAPAMTTPTVASPTVAPVADNSSFGNQPLAHRRTAFGQAPTPEGNAAADWQKRSPQPPWPPGDQVGPAWAPKEQPKAAPPKAPQPGAAPVLPPRAWASREQPSAPTSPAESGSVAPSWFDRLNQPVDDPAARTVTNPTKADLPKTADDHASTATPAAAGAADLDTDDDDWPTRYSWLEDDETVQAGETGETVAARTVTAEAVPEEAKAAEPAATPTVEATDEDEDEPPAPQGSDARLVTVIPGVPRYHDPDCILIRFMDEEDIARKSIPEAKADNCTPCAACQPEG